MWNLSFLDFHFLIVLCYKKDQLTFQTLWYYLDIKESILYSRETFVWLINCKFRRKDDFWIALHVIYSISQILLVLPMFLKKNYRISTKIIQRDFLVRIWHETRISKRTSIEQNIGISFEKLSLTNWLLKEDKKISILNNLRNPKKNCLSFKTSKGFKISIPKSFKKFMKIPQIFLSHLLCSAFSFASKIDFSLFVFFLLFHYSKRRIFFSFFYLSHSYFHFWLSIIVMYFQFLGMTGIMPPPHNFHTENSRYHAKSLNMY